MSTFRDIYKRPTITDRNHVMTFGKFEGETIQDILDNDPQYLCWLVDNTDFDLHCDLLDEAENNGRPDHEFKGWTQRPDSSEHADRINADGEAANFYEPF